MSPWKVGQHSPVECLQYLFNAQNVVLIGIDSSLGALLADCNQVVQIQIGVVPLVVKGGTACRLAHLAKFGVLQLVVARSEELLGIGGDIPGIRAAQCRVDGGNLCVGDLELGVHDVHARVSLVFVDRIHLVFRAGSEHQRR